jgi:hypothetical protein
MLEQLGEADEALPVGQILRQHLGRERLPDDGHRQGLPGKAFSEKIAQKTIEPCKPGMNPR